MGYIKEPKGIDLTVVPQTKQDQVADDMVSEYIRKDKAEKKSELKKKVSSDNK